MRNLWRNKEWQIVHLSISFITILEIIEEQFFEE